MKCKDKVTVDEVIEYLNSLVKADAEAMNQIFGRRVTTNKQMSLTNCQTQSETFKSENQYGYTQWKVGPLGIIAGLFGQDSFGCGTIAAKYDSETGKIVGFCRYERPSI